MCTKNETVTVLGTVIILGVYVYKKNETVTVCTKKTKLSQYQVPLYYVYKKKETVVECVQKNETATVLGTVQIITI